MKMNMIFGSTAIKHHFPDYSKNCNDLDIIGVGKNENSIEYHYSPAFDLIQKQEYISSDDLYTVKVSHLPWNGNNVKWFKHLSDVVFLQQKNCVLNIPFLNSLHKDWSKLFNDDKSKINLNQSANNFFNKNVKRKFNHDDVHEIFKITNIPVFKLIIKNENTALTCKRKFENLSEDLKLYSVLEEMFVIAFEREISLGEAYKTLITKLSKGFWNLYCIESANKILNNFEKEKLEFRKKRNILRKNHE